MAPASGPMTVLITPWPLALTRLMLGEVICSEIGIFQISAVPCDRSGEPMGTP
jgi:hypothetical protein